MSGTLAAASPVTMSTSWPLTGISDLGWQIQQANAGARYDGGAGQLAKKARIEWMAR
jgi:hypothetical protein